MWSMDSLELLCWNIVGLICNIVWTGVTTGLVFWILNRLNFILIIMFAKLMFQIQYAEGGNGT